MQNIINVIRTIIKVILHLILLLITAIIPLLVGFIWETVFYCLWLFNGKPSIQPLSNQQINWSDPIVTLFIVGFFAPIIILTTICYIFIFHRTRLTQSFQQVMVWFHQSKFTRNLYLIMKMIPLLVQYLTLFLLLMGGSNLALANIFPLYNAVTKTNEFTKFSLSGVLASLIIYIIIGGMSASLANRYLKFRKIMLNNLKQAQNKNKHLNNSQNTN